MMQHHPVLKTVIFRKADTEGLSHTKLSALIGDGNTAKGSARLADFRHTGQISNDRLLKLIQALKIQEEEVNAALCKETIAFEERSLEKWKLRAKVPQRDCATCNECVFRSRRQPDVCGHALLDRKDGSLELKLWIGYVRPEWCPVRYD